MGADGSGTAAMTDASKRLHDAVDDVVGDAGTATMSASAIVPPTPMNRTLRALQPVNTEHNLSAPMTRDRFVDVMNMNVSAAPAGVPRATRIMAEDLRRANPSISLQEAQRLYPSIPLDGGNAQDGGRVQTGNVAAGSDGVATAAQGTRVILVEEDNGLPVYTHPSPWAGA